MNFNMSVKNKKVIKHSIVTPLVRTDRSVELTLAFMLINDGAWNSGFYWYYYSCWWCLEEFGTVGRGVRAIQELKMRVVFI